MHTCRSSSFKPKPRPRWINFETREPLASPCIIWVWTWSVRTSFSTCTENWKGRTRWWWWWWWWSGFLITENSRFRLFLDSWVVIRVPIITGVVVHSSGLLRIGPRWTWHNVCVNGESVLEQQSKLISSHSMYSRVATYVGWELGLGTMSCRLPVIPNFRLWRQRGRRRGSDFRRVQPRN